MSEVQAKCVESYRRLKNLKLVANEVGIPWQTVYVHLRAAGEPVTGDKLRYGSDTDRFAAKAERVFQDLVPLAESQNEKKFQSKVDFMVGRYSVDVKASRYRHDRWAFSLKKQERIADFFVCFAFDEADGYRVIVIPGEVCPEVPDHQPVGAEPHEVVGLRGGALCARRVLRCRSARRRKRGGLAA